MAVSALQLWRAGGLVSGFETTVSGGPGDTDPWRRHLLVASGSSGPGDGLLRPFTGGTPPSRFPSGSVPACFSFFWGGHGAAASGKKEEAGLEASAEQTRLESECHLCKMPFAKTTGSQQPAKSRVLGSILQKCRLSRASFPRCYHIFFIL